MLLALLLACGGSTADSVPDATPREPVALRVATFNVSLYRDSQGQLAEDLSDPAHSQAVALATVLQEVRPDVVLLNEVDQDADGTAIARLVANFLAVSQDGREPLSYPHTLVPPTNTGLASGFDLNNDGQVVTTPGSREYGEDCWGFGEFPGQFGLAVLSRYPLTGQRSFQAFPWSSLENPDLPDGWYDPDEAAAMRLSSKNHVDVTVDVDGAPLHLLVSHPTPPGFDGPEDRNGRRNRAEVRFWADYLDDADGIVDDDGTAGGLGPDPFVILGDLNADPSDGGSGEGIATLLAHPRVFDPQPVSSGAVEASDRQGGANDGQSGDPALDTADFSDGELGNLRVDYALPSSDLTVTGSGVFWPAQGEPLFDVVARAPFAISDHRLVWVDLER